MQSPSPVPSIWRGFLRCKNIIINLDDKSIAFDFFLAVFFIVYALQPYLVSAKGRLHYAVRFYCISAFYAEFVAAVSDRGAVYVEIAGDFAMSHTTEITVEDGFFTFGQVHFADDFVRL